MKIFSKFTLPQIEYDSSDYLPENIVPNHLWWNIKKFTFLGKFKVCTRFKLIFFSLQFLILNNNKTWYRPRKNSRSFLVIFFQNNEYLAFLLVFCRFIYFFSEITCSRMIDFKKVYQAVNRPSNTDSIFDNYSMPQNVYD